MAQPSCDSPKDKPDSDPPCVKLPIAENFNALLEAKYGLCRESEIQTIDCDKETLEKVFNNYVIVKVILKHLPWQDKMASKRVTPLWRSTVETLLKEQLRQVDFSIDLTMNAVKKGIVLKKSTEFLNIPMCVFVFCNSAAINEYGTVKCMALLPHPCNPPCEKEHSVLDMIHRTSCGPAPLMFVTKAYNVAYLPLQKSLTYDNAIKKLRHNSIPFFCGFAIPNMKDVEFTAFSTPTAREHTEELKEELKKLGAKNIIKAIIVNMTDHYMLFLGNGNNSVLECFRDIQPDQPFALGGCLVEDTFSYQEDLDDIIAHANREITRIACKQVSLAIFHVPKDAKEMPSFEVFSCVVDKAAWSKPQILQEISEFSKRIPHYENSIALKMSCAGRQSKHDAEQNYFRQFFPDTPLAGCFGNGELGVNYPPAKPTDDTAAKKPKTDMAYEHVHSYSTAFMYFGWGRLVKPAEVDTLNK